MGRVFSTTRLFVPFVFTPPLDYQSSHYLFLPFSLYRGCIYILPTLRIGTDYSRLFLLYRERVFRLLKRGCGSTEKPSQLFFYKRVEAWPCSSLSAATSQAFLGNKGGTPYVPSASAAARWSPSPLSDARRRLPQSHNAPLCDVWGALLFYCLACSPLKGLHK